MIRRLTLLFAMLLTFSSPVSFGLGLGELDLQSALNQRFHAEIELRNIRGLEVEEILPNLGSRDDFERVGVERNYSLIDLRFKVIRKGDDRMVVLVTSSKLIIEPFLNFVVEVLWPSGRILREYTVLLDPPVFAEEAVEPVQVSQTEQRSPEQRQGTQVAPQAGSPPPPAQTPASSTALDQGSISGGEYGMTARGDTLWAIALKVRPNPSISVQQTMLALKAANPEAFINDNINLLKAGYVLRIPSVSEIHAETFTEAVAQVRIQNEEFRIYKSGGLAQLDATRRRRSSADSGSSDDGELKLLAPDQSGASERIDSGAEERIQQLNNELAVNEEDLDRARRANTELNVRFKDLEDQLQTLTQILALKDDQIAALQADLKRIRERSGAQAATSVAETVTPDIETITPAEQAATPVTEPRVAVPFTDQPLMSFLGTCSFNNIAGCYQLLSNPIVLGGIGFVVLLIVIGGVLLIRRNRDDDDEEEEDEVFVIYDDDEAEPATTDGEDEFEEVQVVEVAVEEEEESLSLETSDVISEVEIYIAYGRFPQAITFLQNAIEEEPTRTDIQLKLLQVYVQTEDSTAFNLQFEQMKTLGDQEAIQAGQELQAKIPGAAEDASVAMDETIISAQPIAEPADDLSFDLDDLGTETDDEALDLDLELDLGDDDEVELELDLDLDLDDDLKLDLGDDDEISLDLGDLDDEISLDLGDDDEISLDLDDDDEMSLDKLDLARAYIDMGDGDGARSVLEGVLQEGSDSEKREANELMEKID